jgi:hypothetical protein
MWCATNAGRMRVRWSMALMLCAAASCSQGVDAVDPKVPGVDASTVVTESLNDSTFTHFAANLTMTATGIQTFGSPTLVSTVKFHVDRTLHGTGGWTTTTSFDSAGQLGKPVTGSVSTYDVGTSVISGGTMQLLNRQGGVLSKPAPVSFDTLTATQAQYDTPALRAIPPMPASAPHSLVAANRTGAISTTLSAASPGRDPRAWIRPLILRPPRRATMRASIVASLGAPTGKVGTLDRFTTTKGETLFEQLVDHATGALMEENVAERGILKVHTQHRYLTLSDGTLVRMGSRTEVANAPGGQHVVYDVSYTNIQLDTPGGDK